MITNQLTGKGRRPFTIHLKAKAMKVFKEYCETQGYLLARRLEILMIRDMNKEKI